MELSLIFVEFAFVATLMRALLVAARILPPSCGRCGRQFERKELGETVCRCGLD